MQNEGKGKGVGRWARGRVGPAKEPASQYAQQFTYGVVREGVFAESLRKFCGKFAEICKEMRFVAPGKGAEILRKVCGNFAEICGKFPAMTPSRPCPSFPCFFWKKARKTTKKQGFFIPTEPLKSLEKKRKTPEKTRNSTQGEKTRNSKKTRKGRTGERPHKLIADTHALVETIL